ncbi:MULTISPECIES: hypothetical protein [unclassified Streptomyces]|uniref:hypothetical protein n=1 Tax=unclassified Streptomyces TaxID=2593676 RepID=UPI0035DE37C4
MSGQRQSRPVRREERARKRLRRPETDRTWEPPETGERHRLTAVTGLAALSLDAMASVGYGPEAIVLVRAAAEPGIRVTVLIPEVEPERVWQRLLQNQRGAVVAHAVRRDTDAVICRLRFRPA